MKKFITVSAAVLALTAFSAMPAAAEDSITVNVTIADADGALAAAQEQVTVTDLDSDGALTINDALISAHDAFYTGGAEAGYGYYTGDYGLSMSKLWGTENGSGYGYYVNNAAAFSLADAVKEGDYINAFVYTDTTAWSDKYCWFNENTLSANADEEIELTLSAAGYDADWNPVTVAVEGAVILVDGEATDYKTDADGKVTIALGAGSHIVSAKSDSAILVPPVLKAEIAGETVTTNSQTTETSTETTTSATASATTTTTAAATTTTKAAATTTGASSPKTGDSVPALGIAVLAGAAALIAARKRNED